MDRRRKTADVEPLARSLQYALDRAETTDERRAFCFAIEQVLFSTNNYDGFSYRNGYHPSNPTFDEYDRVYTLRNIP